MLTFGMTQYFIVYQWQVQYGDHRSQVRLEDRSLYNGKYTTVNTQCLLAKINYTLQNRVLALRGN